MAKDKPDKLAQDAAKAKAANMSYGRWKALQPIAPTANKLPDGWKRCEYCGTPFKGVQGKRFCDVTCQKQSYKERQRQGAL